MKATRPTEVTTSQRMGFWGLQTFLEARQPWEVDNTLRANSSLSKHPSSEVHKPWPGPPQRQAGSRTPTRSQGSLWGQKVSVMAFAVNAHGSQWANPLSFPEGIVAPQSLGGLSGNTKPFSTGFWAHRAWDCKMCRTERHLCTCCLVFVSLIRMLSFLKARPVSQL